MAKPVPPRDDRFLMDFIGFLACLTFVQRLVNGYRLARVQLGDIAAGDIAKPIGVRHADEDALLLMRHSIPNLERPLMLRHVSTNIPNQFLGCRRCGSDEIRFFLRIRDERHGNTDVRSIQRENASLRQLLLCRICLSRERLVVFLPCGHLLTCDVCGQGPSVCPACGVRVASRVVVKR